MAATSKKGVNWTQKEDEALCKGFLKVIEDNIHGTSQASDGFWTHVSHKYYKLYEGTIEATPRNLESCASVGGRSTYIQA